MIYGAIKRGGLSSEREKWREPIHLLLVLPFPLGATKKYGAIRADLEWKGQVIGSNDLWIAAHGIPARARTEDRELDEETDSFRPAGAGLEGRGFCAQVLDEVVEGGYVFSGGF